MDLARRIVARYLAAETQVGAKKFGRFNVQFLPQHASIVEPVGTLLLKAEAECAKAGFSIPHDIEVLLTGRGAAHANAIYYAQEPPTIKIAPKAYNRPDLIHTLIHELGHYFHDKVVPGGFNNRVVGARYTWSVRQTPTGEGNAVDALTRKIKALEEEHTELGKKLYSPPKKGALVEFDHRWFGKVYHVKGRVLGKSKEDPKFKMDVEVSEPADFIAILNSVYRRPVLPTHNSDLSTADPVIKARLTEITAETNQLVKDRHEIVQGKKHDDVYESQQHDWVPTTYARKNKLEWFAELFVTDVLGHLAKDPSDWLKSIVQKGTPPG